VKGLTVAALISGAVSSALIGVAGAAQDRAIARFFGKSTPTEKWIMRWLGGAGWMLLALAFLLQLVAVLQS
jgi:hypothetical protein